MTIQQHCMNVGYLPCAGIIAELSLVQAKISALKESAIKIRTELSDLNCRRTELKRAGAKLMRQESKPLTGEMPMKVWRYQEAKREGVAESAIAMRLSRGQYPDIIIRRVNQRVVFVKV